MYESAEPQENSAIELASSPCSVFEVLGVKPRELCNLIQLVKCETQSYRASLVIQSRNQALRQGLRSDTG